jgi:hypothetical protein
MHEGALINLTILHNDNEILCWILDKADVVDRIAIHEQKVREGICFNDPKFPLIGATWTRQREEFGIGGRRHRQDLGV